MDLSDEVRFRVSPDITDQNTNERVNRYNKISNRKDNQRVKLKKKQSGQSTSSTAITHGYRFQAVVNQDGLIELDLSNRKLRNIPEEVLRLARLEVLNISHNEFKSFTSQFSLLHRLKKLDVSWNSIFALPETFANLKHLKELDLSHNALQTLPSNIYALVHLRLLKLDHNRLENLPHQTGFLPVLRNLSISGNQLWNLPKSFSKLSKLRSLNLSGNAFDQLPATVCDLHDLELLDIHDNNILNLPAEFEKLQKLKELNLSGNQLESVPYIICQLRHIRSLNLSNNRIIGIPPRFHKLTKLRILNLQKNLLKSLPNLPSVEYLNIAQNQIHNLSLSTNKHLKHLNASSNYLEDMPLGLYNQKHLEVLKLSRNQIGYISQDVVLLQKLKHLDLSHNQLRSLPQVIYELEKLQTFNIKGNHIQRRVGNTLGIQNGVPRLFYQNNGSPGLQRSTSMDRIESRPIPHYQNRINGYGSDSNINYEDFEGQQPPPRHLKAGWFDPHPWMKRNYKRPNGGRKTEAKNRPWFKWRRKRKEVTQSWPQTRTYATQYTPVSQQRHSRKINSDNSNVENQGKSFNSLSYHDLRNQSQSEKVSAQVQSYLHSNTLPLPTKSGKTQGNHKSVAETNYLFNNVVNGTPRNPYYTDDPRNFVNSSSSYHRHKTANNSTINIVPGSNRTPRSNMKGNSEFYHLKEPSYTTIGMVSTHREESEVSSVAAATVAEWETVGDELSLGEEEYKYQPTSVEDKRLRGVARSVEKLLGEQLLEPVNRGQSKIKQQDIQNWPVQHLSFRKYPRMPSRQYEYTSEGEASWYSVPETRTSLLTEPAHRLVPRKNDIIMKSPFENLQNVPLKRKSTVKFTVTAGGGTFHSETDKNIKVHFPVGAVDFPVECQMQVQPIHEDIVGRSQFYHHSILSNLVAMGPIVTLSCAEQITLSMPVSLTLKAPVSGLGGHVHVLNYHRDASCTPCTARQTRHHGYITIEAWNLEGKCTALTKSRDPILASSTVEYLLQAIDLQ